MKVKKRKRLPYIIYYEGMQRFCPYFSKDGDKIFRVMLDKLLKNGMIDQDTYDRVKDLKVGEVARIYGTMYICRHLCPVYKQRRYFDREKIFISPTISNQATVSRLFASESEKSQVLSILSNLGSLRSQSLVAEIRPEMNVSGHVGGYCIRAVLSKAVTTSKVQVVMHGALILTPIHALDFVVSQVVGRIKTLRARGFNIPTPLVIIDEYDYYIYKPVDMDVYTLDQLKYEKEVAAKVAREERDKRLRGDPTYDWERLVASTIAYKILSDLENECKAFLDTYRKEASSEHLESACNMFIECASKPLTVENTVYPPFAPRVIRFDRYKPALMDVYGYLEKVEEGAFERYGVSFFDPKTAKSLGLRHFLSLWENILVLESRASGKKFMVPALYRSHGTVYKTGYIESDEVRSIAKDFANLVLSSHGGVAVFYKVVPVEGRVISGGRTVSNRGGVVTCSAYDFRLYKIFRSDVDVLLMSATGVPWLSGIFTTRSEGVGAKVPYLDAHYAGSQAISTVYSNIKASNIGVRKDFTYMIISSSNFSKPLVVVMLDLESMKTYASHASLFRVEDLPNMPPKTRAGPAYIRTLMSAVSPYVKMTAKIMSGIMKGATPLPGAVPSILVLTQRKDVSVAFTAMLYQQLRDVGLEPEVDVCRSTMCRRVQDLATILKEVATSSHLLVSIKRNGVEVFRFYITWLRSRMSRGVDLPDDTTPYAVVMVGSPYRPPYAFDILTKTAVEGSDKSTYIEFRIFVDSYDYRNLVTIVHNPIDIAEAVGEFIQAVGRALRKAWKTSLDLQTIAYRVGIILQKPVARKVTAYSPLWFRFMV